MRICTSMKANPMPTISSSWMLRSPSSTSPNWMHFYWNISPHHWQPHQLCPTGFWRILRYQRLQCIRICTAINKSMQRNFLSWPILNLRIETADYDHYSSTNSIYLNWSRRLSLHSRIYSPKTKDWHNNSKFIFSNDLHNMLWWQIPDLGCGYLSNVYAEYSTLKNCRYCKRIPNELDYARLRLLSNGSPVDEFCGISIIFYILLWF